MIRSRTWNVVGRVRILVLLGVLVACRPGPRITMPATQGTVIATVTLQWSNVHLVFGSHALIVDSGAQGEFPDLVSGLRALGVKLADVKCAVITHGHADHAGTARALQVNGVKIIAGAGDLERTRHGEHGKHNPTGIFSWMLKFLLPETYKPFVADIQVTDRYDLSTECGVAGEVIAMPGHTAGSVVVLVAGGKVALVGDLFRGGKLGGFVSKTTPMVHFYQDDKALAHQHIRELLARGIEWFVLGHGGPSTRAQVTEKVGH